MQLLYKEYDDFLVFGKPAGVRTHKVSDDQFGFVEYLTEKTAKSLFVVHRLDKDTSGLILFAKSKEAAAELSKLFETREIQKTYMFLTDQEIAKTEAVIETHIEKQDEFFINNSNKEPNSKTFFKFIEKIGEKKYLWQAAPLTGKPHQIRLHAQKLRVPILGDNQHGGSVFYRLALHAHKLQFNYKGEEFEVSSDYTPFKGLFRDCFNARKNLYSIPTNESFRLIHTEHPHLRADVFADRLWVYDYFESELPEALKTEAYQFAEQNNLKPIIRRMLNRGQGVGGLEQSTLETENKQSWVAEESSVKYLLKTDSGFSPGLFLDQRENRLWVKNNSAQKSVLNLFSYTSGFSVNAAVGSASQVTTVDVSKKFLDWSQENFKINNIETEKHEFFSQDTLLFLKGSVKRGRKWDLIICDPPSFGRSKDGAWKLEKDLPELAELMLNCLNKKGQILFTCNLERKTRQDIINLFCKKLNKGTLKIERMPMLCLDYEVTDDIHNLMKGFILTKN
jgi:23S rRNA (cytosine1962-C5)-methyltransferase